MKAKEIRAMTDEGLAEELRSAVDDARLTRELGHRSHETRDLYDLRHAIEAAEHAFDRRQRVEHGNPRVLFGIRSGNQTGPLSHFARSRKRPRDEGKLTRCEHEIARNHGGNIRGHGGRHLGERDAEFGEARFYTHCQNLSVSLIVST
jgi:hypothetical protein